MAHGTLLNCLLSAASPQRFTTLATIEAIPRYEEEYPRSPTDQPTIGTAYTQRINSFLSRWLLIIEMTKHLCKINLNAQLYPHEPRLTDGLIKSKYTLNSNYFVTICPRNLRTTFVHST